MIKPSEPSIPEHLAGAVLGINLDAIVGNYRTLCQNLDTVACAAVVKANAYGLGLEPVAMALAKAGCEIFFVAHIDEGIRLRRLLPDHQIHVLNGLMTGSESDFRSHCLIPVLGSLQEIRRWQQSCGSEPQPCDLHIDTGMLRLGLPPSELATIANDPSLLSGLDLQLVLSHLASADDAASVQNQQQLELFRQARQIIPTGRASFCNSSGIFLGADYHFDIARPGVALYGINPTPTRPNPMQAVVTLHARILQVREASPPAHVGYGASFAICQPSRVATAAIGYADGIPRALSNRSHGYIDGLKVPLIGRISMDLTTFDVSNTPAGVAVPGQWIELIGPNHSLEQLAQEADTISYEILTSLGRRYHRVYKGG